MKTRFGTLVIDRTEREAQAYMDGLTMHIHEDRSAVGVGGAVYHTFSRLFIRRGISLDEKTWDWLTREVHLHDIEDVRWYGNAS